MFCSANSAADRARGGEERARWVVGGWCGSSTPSLSIYTRDAEHILNKTIRPTTNDSNQLPAGGRGCVSQKTARQTSTHHLHNHSSSLTLQNQLLIRSRSLSLSVSLLLSSTCANISTKFAFPFSLSPVTLRCSLVYFGSQTL